jgi:hypothetical protein
MKTSRIAAETRDVLHAIAELPIDRLEELMQYAHECTPNQHEEPEERLPVTRQALRMLWHFRCHLDAVTVFPPETAPDA